MWGASPATGKAGTAFRPQTNGPVVFLAAETAAMHLAGQRPQDPFVHNVLTNA
jgi:hypothetical protein